MCVLVFFVFSGSLKNIRYDKGKMKSLSSTHLHLGFSGKVSAPFPKNFIPFLTHVHTFIKHHVVIFSKKMNIYIFNS